MKASAAIYVHGMIVRIDMCNNNLKIYSSTTLSLVLQADDPAWITQY